MMNKFLMYTFLLTGILNGVLLILYSSDILFMEESRGSTIGDIIDKMIITYMAFELFRLYRKYKTG